MYYDVKEPQKHAEKSSQTQTLAVCVHEVHKSGHTHRESTMVRQGFGAWCALWTPAWEGSGGPQRDWLAAPAVPPWPVPALQQGMAPPTEEEL